MPGSFVVRLNPLHKTLLMCLFLFPFCATSLSRASAWNYEETHNDSRDFVAGGFLHVRLRVGDVHIRRGDSNKISLHYTVKSGHERNIRDAHVDFEIHGSDATIEFHAPSGDNTQFDAELEVPQKTNLDVHNKVGDVTVEDVEGDKDLSLGVGDIRVANKRAEYRLVNASAGIGDVNSDGYGVTSGWLGKTLRYHGEGKYEMRAHVGVGDIRLEGK